MSTLDSWESKLKISAQVSPPPIPIILYCIYQTVRHQWREAVGVLKCLTHNRDVGWYQLIKRCCLVELGDLASVVCVLCNIVKMVKDVMSHITCLMCQIIISFETKSSTIHLYSGRTAEEVFTENSLYLPYCRERTIS
jgi:hypothetical protein